MTLDTLGESSHPEIVSDSTSSPILSNPTSLPESAEVQVHRLCFLTMYRVFQLLNRGNVALETDLKAVVNSHTFLSYLSDVTTFSMEGQFLVRVKKRWAAAGFM